MPKVKTPKELPSVGVPVQYKNCYIVRADDGFDCVDLHTGRWIHLPDARRARWNATVWSRLSYEFGGSSTRTFTNEQVLAGVAYATK
jgi:hypothetical protein